MANKIWILEAPESLLIAGEAHFCYQAFVRRIKNVLAAPLACSG